MATCEGALALALALTLTLTLHLSPIPYTLLLRVCTLHPDLNPIPNQAACKR